MEEVTLKRLLEVSTLLSAELNLQRVLILVANVATELTDTTDASILLRDGDDDSLRFVVATGSLPLDEISVPLEGSLAGWVVRHAEPVIVDDNGRNSLDDVRHYSAIDRDYSFQTHSLLAVPLISRGRAIGALEVLNKRDNRPYLPEDVTVLQALASHAAVAIENARLFRQTDFVAEMVHELRTPLVSMSLAATLLQRRELPVSQRDEVVATLQREIDRLDRLVGDFHNLARLESGRLQLTLRPTDIRLLITDVVALHKPQAAERAISLDAELSEALPYVKGDAARIKQILINLVSNAIKYNVDGGSVTLRAAVDGDELQIDVSDTGPGIAPKHLERLFERFYRVPADKERASGSGLGLFIARTIVDAHGGRLDVTSEPGRGTTFSCWLPLA